MTKIKLIKRTMFGRAGFAGALANVSFTPSKTKQLVSLLPCCFRRHLSGTGWREHRPPVPIRPLVFIDGNPGTPEREVLLFLIRHVLSSANAVAAELGVPATVTAAEFYRTATTTRL